jgi:hypothetical protein
MSYEAKVIVGWAIFAAFWMGFFLGASAAPW